MKKFKKLSALLLAAIMVLTMAVPVMAEGTTIGPENGNGTPAVTDKGKVTITNVYEDNAEVKAYRITKAVYDGGFKGYEVTDKENDTFTVAAHYTSSPDHSTITYQEVMDIANDQQLLNKLEQRESDGDFATLTAKGNGVYEGDLGPGYWVVKIIGNEADKIYNPLLVGVYYHTGNNEQVDKKATITLSGNDVEGVVYAYNGTEYVRIADPAGWYNLDGTAVSDSDVLSALDALFDQGKSVKVNKDDDGEYLYMDPTPLDAETKWGLGASPAVAKESKISLNKEITDNSDHDPAHDSAAHGDDHGFGDIVYFKGTTSIPAYSADYKKLTYVLSDKMDKIALKMVGKEATPGYDPDTEHPVAPETEADKGNNADNTPYIVLTIGSTSYNILKNQDKVVFVEAKDATDTEPAVKEQSAEIEWIDAEGKVGFKITFNEEAIRQHPDQQVELRYQARILKGATANFDENTNELSVEYTNNPEEDQNGDNATNTLKDKTFHYTFEIDGNLDGSTTESGEHTNRHGHELVKTGEQEVNGNRIVFTNANGTKVYAKLHTDNRYYLTNEAGEFLKGKMDNTKKRMVLLDGTTITTTPAEFVPAVEWTEGEKEKWTVSTAPMGLAGAKFKLTYKAPDRVGEKYVYNNTTYNTYDDAVAAVKAAQALDPNAPDTITTVPGKVLTLTEAKALKADGKQYVCVTDAGGRMHFKGLDTGYYELEEIEPPTGYSLNSHKITVRITAEYYASDVKDTNDNILFEAGELKAYTIWRAEKDFENVADADFAAGQKSVYEESRQKAGDVVNSTIAETYEGADTTFFENTKMPVLPSTGGMGTYLFTIAGVAILGVAAFLLIVKRRRA